jgi:hypothetical protein
MVGSGRFWVAWLRTGTDNTPFLNFVPENAILSFITFDFVRHDLDRLLWMPVSAAIAGPAKLSRDNPKRQVRSELKRLLRFSSSPTAQNKRG